jgi:hypothetical protein
MVLVGSAHIQTSDKKKMHKEDRVIVFALTCRFLISPKEVSFRAM